MLTLFDARWTFIYNRRQMLRLRTALLAQNLQKLQVLAPLPRYPESGSGEEGGTPAFATYMLSAVAVAVAAAAAAAGLLHTPICAALQSYLCRAPISRTCDAREPKEGRG